MKKLYFSLVIFFFTLSVFAQKGLELGVRGMAQNNWLINSDDFAEGAELDFELTWGSAYGIVVGYNFTDKVGVRTNVLLSMQGQKYFGDLSQPSNIDSSSYIGQNFVYGNTSTNKYTAEVILNYIKLPLLFKVSSNPDETAFFTFEIGPQINMLQSATHIIDGKKVDYSLIGTKDLYSATTYSVVFGFGADFSLSDDLKLNANFRFDYGLTDAENKAFEVSGVKVWNEYRPITNAASGGLMLGLTYVIN